MVLKIIFYEKKKASKQFSEKKTYSIHEEHNSKHTVSDIFSRVWKTTKVIFTITAMVKIVPYTEAREFFVLHCKPSNYV